MRRDVLARWGAVAVGVLLLSAVAVAAGQAGTKSKGAKAQGSGMGALPVPDYLPELARTLLKERMERHGTDALELSRSVLLLQNKQVQEIATRIASEPRLVRPVKGSEDALNAALPERFFVFQDELRDRARMLAEAAAGKDPKALARAYGHLMETCVSCHAVYLNPPAK